MKAGNVGLVMPRGKRGWRIPAMVLLREVIEPGLPKRGGRAIVPANSDGAAE